MFYEIDKNDHGLPYNPIKACVVPRPIGWITSISHDGLVNAAPYSFLIFLATPHRTLFFSRWTCGGPERKDSVANVRLTGDLYIIWLPGTSESR